MVKRSHTQIYTATLFLHERALVAMRVVCQQGKKQRMERKVNATAIDQGIFNRPSGCCIKHRLLQECQRCACTHTHTDTQTHTKFAFLQLKNCNLSVQVSHGLWLWTAGLSCVSLPISGLQLFLETSLLKGTACARARTHTHRLTFTEVCVVFSATSYSCFQLSTN